MRIAERSLLVLLTLAVAALTLNQTLEARPARAKLTLDAESNVAVCAIPSVINDLMESDRYRPERERLEEDLADEREELNEEFEQISERARQMNPEDPAAGEVFTEWRTAMRELSEFDQQASRRQARMRAQQMAAAYELARSSASAIADDLGFDYVMICGDERDELNTSDALLLLGQLSRRPVIKWPDNANITEDVREDLGLD
jgi:Skp family chaperone for outer membrane proteins